MKRVLDLARWQAKVDAGLASLLSKGRGTCRTGTWNHADHLRAPSIDHIELWVPPTSGHKWVWREQTTVLAEVSSRGIEVLVGQGDGAVAHRSTNKGGTTLSLNPNRALDPGGWKLWPYALCVEVIEGAAAWLAAEFDCDPLVVGVRTMDLARDVEMVSCPSWFVESMRNLPRPGRQHSKYEGRHGAGESAYALSGKSHTKIYDKAAQLRQQHPTLAGEAHGVLRAELRLATNRPGEGWILGPAPLKAMRHAGIRIVDEIGRIYKGMDALEGGPPFDPSSTFDGYMGWFGADLVFLEPTAMRRYLALRGASQEDIDWFVDMALRREYGPRAYVDFLIEMISFHRCWISGTVVDGPVRLSAGGMLFVTGEMPELGWDSCVIRHRQLELVAASV